MEKYIRLTNAYESLFNRVFLTILGYTGKYIDYCTVGHPEKSMDENLG